MINAFLLLLTVRDLNALRQTPQVDALQTGTRNILTTHNVAYEMQSNDETTIVVTVTLCMMYASNRFS